MVGAIVSIDVDMQIVIIQGLLCVLIGATTAADTHLQSVTPRKTPIEHITKKLPSHLLNITSTDIITDIRTPPKIKQMIKRVERTTEKTIENSHPGLAQPVDDEIGLIEESMERLHFYKIERPTTDSGLSTWILLSGQTISSSTTKSTSLQDNTENIRRNSSVIFNSNSVAKPLFKKRPSSINIKSSIPTTQKSTLTSLDSTSSSYLQKTIQLTNEVNETLKSNIKHKNISSLNLPYAKINSTNNTMKHTVKLIKMNSTSDELERTTETLLKLKEGDLELPTSTVTSKKSKRPVNKKKKDKNRRKRPSLDTKNDGQNKTKILTKINQKEKPISTQIYNYLAKEVMPTVGVGLVGLVVTAGLASYFLYPFSSLRRSYQIDRKDKDLYYYDGNVSSDYDSGIAEEEAIGKVIAGMPFFSNSYLSNYYQKNYSNNRHKQIDPKFHLNPSVEMIKLHPSKENSKSENYVYDHYPNAMNKNKPHTKNIISQSVEASYNTNDQQFIVGSVPKSIVEATPAAVPEHGPRNLEIRKRRHVNGIMNNGNETEKFLRVVNLPKNKKLRLSKAVQHKIRILGKIP